MTVKEAQNYFHKIKADGPVTKRFSKMHRQRSGGYIANWKKLFGEEGTVNQSWHLESYLALSIADHTIPSLSEDFKKIYNRILCPELLLFIAEASEIEKELVEKVADGATSIINNGERYCRNKAGRYIRSQIPWEMIETAIVKHKAA